MAALLKTALAVLGPARGGGSPQIAQGGGVSAEVEGVERVLRQAESELLNERQCGAAQFVRAADRAGAKRKRGG
jgi:hypothetical protein